VEFSKCIRTGLCFIPSSLVLDSDKDIQKVTQFYHNILDLKACVWFHKLHLSDSRVYKIRLSRHWFLPICRF
jgi:hypothetical protein